MKKIFTLTLVLLAMAFAANAQFLLQEGFEGTDIPAGWTIIDNDGDGNNWYVLNNSQSSSGSFNVHSGDGHITSASYASVALTPDNWLITPAVTLTSNATLSFWAAGQDPSWASEHFSVYISTTGATVTDFTTTLLSDQVVTGDMTQYTVSLASYTGQTVYIAFRHHNITDMFRLNLDDVEILAETTDPMITANPLSINFGTTLLGTPKNATANIAAYNLTSAITATTAAPFSVSADGTAFGSSASIASTGGTLYLRYTPTAVGIDNGTVTLSSTGADNVTINLTGSSIECNGSVPYSYSFTEEAINECWEVINANNDDYTFEFSPSNGYVSIRWNTAMAADDWLISPTFPLTGNEIGSFDYWCASSSYTEKFQVFAIGADTVTLTPVVEVINEDSQTQYLDLSSLTGNYRIAIHGISDADQYRLYISNFSISGSMPQSSVTLSTNSLEFSTTPMGGTSNPKSIVLNTINFNEAITLTTAAPFEVSLDGNTYAATQTIPANSALTTTDSIFVRFAPTTVGSFNQTLTVTSTDFNETVSLSGVSADCSEGITTFPFVYNFNTGDYPPVCWGYNNEENYYQVEVDEDGDYAMGIDGIDMLVTPEITCSNPLVLMFDYTTYLGEYAETPTSFRVGYSSTDNNVASFTWQTPVTISSSPEDMFFNYTSEVPAGTKYIAIDITEIGTYLYLGLIEYTDVVFIDNFTLLTDATLLVSTESLNFGNIIMGSNPVVRTVDVNAVLLTNDIAVSAPANFEVSANGSSYAATATLPQTGGTLYVRYNPTAVGTHTGNVTLTSGSISKTIAVSGNAVDCSNPYSLPFYENFDNGMPSCWAILDEDGDSYSWESSDNPASYFAAGTDLSGNGNDGSYGYILSGSYSNVYGALTPDNWLISPALTIPSEGAKLSFYVAAQDADWAAEHYGVYVSTSGTNPSNFTLLYEEDLDAEGGPRDQGAWKQKNVNLPYGGQTIHLAIRHFNCTDMFVINLDDFSVIKGTGIENHDTYTKIFPNPANNVLNIDANSNIDRVEIYNMMGQLVGTYEANGMNTQISTTALANGVYTVKISTENGMSTKKFTVAR